MKEQQCCELIVVLLTGELSLFILQGMTAMDTTYQKRTGIIL